MTTSTGVPNDGLQDRHNDWWPFSCDANQNRSRQLRNGSALTDFVEVEGVLPRDGAIEARLEERRPAVSVLVGAALVLLAHPSHTGVDSL